MASLKRPDFSEAHSTQQHLNKVTNRVHKESTKTSTFCIPQQHSLKSGTKQCQEGCKTWRQVMHEFAIKNTTLPRNLNNLTYTLNQFEKQRRFA